MKTFKEYLEEAKKGRCWTGYKPVPGKEPYSPGSCEKVKKVKEETDICPECQESPCVCDDSHGLVNETAAWQRKEGKSESGGLNQKGVDSYRRENPGSKLKTAVTTKPSKLKPGSAAANRRKSFCARMSGMKKRLTSAATAKDPDSRINKSLRKWNC
jgi:hypothetical protein